MLIDSLEDDADHSNGIETLLIIRPAVDAFDTTPGECRSICSRWMLDDDDPSYIRSRSPVVLRC